LSSKSIYRLPQSVFTPFFRRFTDERARDLDETIALHREVRARWLASGWSAEGVIDTVVFGIVDDITQYVDPPKSPAIAKVLDRFLRDCLALETTLFTCPDIDWATAHLSLAELVDLRRFLRAQEHFLAHDEDGLGIIIRDLGNVYGGLLKELPDLPEGDSAFTVPLITLVSDARDMIDKLIGTVSKEDAFEHGIFTAMQRRLYENACEATGVVPDAEHNKPLLTAARSELPPLELAQTYLKNTPLLDLVMAPVPFGIPEPLRFEHMHVLAGSGHGKTQTLQHLILADLKKPDPPGLVIIDSQGDMIRKISRLALFDTALRDRLIIIDPRDVEHPPALNMFDVNLERIGRYGTADREQILNGVIELYEYFFGSLLGAELTQKQSLIFRYLARLMIYIPSATIRTMIELMDDTKPYRNIIERLPESSRMFFDKEFGDKQYNETRTQIKRRLYGIVENQTFERMFSAPKNRVDIPAALNDCKIVLVNTAKDFLKGGSSILGRYFIALTLQAALERAAIPEHRRRPAFLYIDEAAEYFDGNIDNLLNQARKYKLGLIMAHQYLDQLSGGLRSSIASNTSIKFAGGVSDRDARSIAPDMRTSPTFILEQRKGARETRFACYLRNVTGSALSLMVPFGTMEKEPVMDDAAHQALLKANRARVTAMGSGDAKGSPEEPIITLHEPDLPWKLERENDAPKPPPGPKPSSTDPSPDW
jgi:hypothetical protein